MLMTDSGMHHHSLSKKTARNSRGRSYRAITFEYGDAPVVVTGGIPA